MTTDMSAKMSAEIGRLANVSEDAVLGGKLVLRQPLRGHRFGHDAILLAAAVAARAGESAVELGSGVGAAGLALARRVEGLDVTLVEIDPALAALAGDNAARNGLAGRVRAVCLDVTAPAAAFAAAGLAPESADHVLMNPPFNAAAKSFARSRPPRRARRSDETLAQWLSTAARLLRPAGDVTLIWRADGLGDVLAALVAGFGAIAVLPVHPQTRRAGDPRAGARGQRAAAARSRFLPGFVLADADGKPTVAAETVLRDGAALALTQS